MTSGKWWPVSTWSSAKGIAAGAKATAPLLDAIDSNKFDAVFGGGRREEEKARAKERVFSLRDEFGAWDPRRQRPELWALYNGRHAPGEHVRVFPLSNWTELDVWQYIQQERIELPQIYYAHERDVFQRDGMWLTAGDWGGPKEGETVERRRIRYRTVGDMSCTGAVDSDATTIELVIAEIAASRLTGRGATRADDKLSEAAMEDRKREGYFQHDHHHLPRTDRHLAAALRHRGLRRRRQIHPGRPPAARLQVRPGRPTGSRRTRLPPARPGGPRPGPAHDGLRAEREQGITIDVAYRYFATTRRRFILADTPGHVQYTRNMVTGASTAELAVALVDARNGVVEQTRRHAAVAALLRVPHVVLAVNKMDLVD